MKMHNCLIWLLVMMLGLRTAYTPMQSALCRTLAGIGRSLETPVEVNLMFAGDVCLEEDGFVIDEFDKTGKIEACISPDIIEKTNAADLFFLNHEYTCTTLGTPLPGKYYTFRAKPERMSILSALGTDIVSLANNHIFDYGPEAMLDTLRNLKKAGIAYVGGGRNKEEALSPIYRDVQGIRVGYVAASRAEKYRFTPAATDTEPGIFLMYELDELKAVITEAAKNCDYLIVSLHWGTEDSPYFEEYQRTIAKTVIECGADVIVGGHPHVLQGIEFINGKPVIYSLGDFWFNHETKYTGLLNLKLSKKKDDIQTEVSFIPCQQAGFKTRELTEPEEKRDLFQYLESLSPNIAIDEEGVISVR